MQTVFICKQTDCRSMSDFAIFKVKEADVEGFRQHYSHLIICEGASLQEALMQFQTDLEDGKVKQ